jgi:ribosomal protein L7/L12
MNCGLGKNSMSLEDAPPLSESIKVLADDPRRKIEAVKAYKLETGVDLAMAKRVVEDYIDRDRTAS